ncbi:hypothetical protein K432DRAFT_259588, partial [Lepidopterella palustris CBS 459.81]
LPHAIQAAFNSSDKEHDALCLQHTRVDVLDQIRTWADGVDERCIFWLNGMAGTGKSTIARTIAREYYNQERLGASFFFSRGTEDRSHAGKLFTTIAVQLANVSPMLKEHICTAIAKHNDIANQSQRDRWKHLILQPLSVWTAPPNQSPLILVIDALDECDDDKDVQRILQLFAEMKSLSPMQLRVFVTSRPETPIRLGFQDIPSILHQDLVLDNVPREIIDHDIAIYFRHELKNIELSVQRVECLIDRAYGLFIWAATACRYIKGGKHFAEKRLSLILNGKMSGKSPEKVLDEIYIKILSDLIRGEYEDDEMEELFIRFRRIVGAIAILFNPLSTEALSELLKPTQGVKQMLGDLHSVLKVPESPTYPIRLLHPSFRDFILAKERCQDPQLWVDEKEAHKTLADACIRIMSVRLRRDICGLRAPGTLAKDIQAYQIEQYLPAELQYACRFWIEHLLKSDTQFLDKGQVHIFLREHLLHWLEALSLIGKVSEGVLSIISLGKKSPSLYAFLYDAKRFVLNNRSIIEYAPLQIYCSALVFAPQRSLVRKEFEQQMPSWIPGLPKVQEEWSLALQTLEGH